RIAARPKDEIGLHVHWGNHARPDGRPVDLHDRQWVESEVRATTASLTREAAGAIVSFRSGGHMVVPGLPGILEGLGSRFAGSVEERRGSRTRRIHAMLGSTTDPSSPDRLCACRPGNAALLEVPTSLHLHDFASLQRVWPHLFPTDRQRVISV